MDIAVRDLSAVVVRSPGFSRDGRRRTAVVPTYLWVLQVMAGLIPSIAAILMMLTLKDDDPWFRYLVVSLMILGSAGFPLAMYLSGLLSKALAALTGSSDEGPRRRRRE